MAPTLELCSLQGSPGSQPALVCGDAVFTGEMLDARSDALAEYFAAHGVGARHRVALLLGNTPAFVVCTLALMKLRAASVLLGTRLTPAEIADVVRRTEAMAIVAAPTAAAKLVAVAATDAGSTLPVDPLLDPLAMWRCATSTPAAEDGELFLQLTSGVTGRSLIVARTVANLAHELEHFASRLRLGRDDATVCPCPLAHAYGLVNGFLLPFFSGRPAILVDWFVPSGVVEIVRRYRPRVLVGVPAMYEALSRTYGTTRADFASLAICFSAGAPLPGAAARDFRDRYGIAIRQQYGSTETGVIAVNLEDEEALDACVVGRPVQAREVTIVGDDRCQARVGDSGEIAVRSDGSATRYVDDPAQSAARFRDGWYFTGDLGTLSPDGAIRLQGRRTSFINVGGLKVHHREVEDVILRLDGVVECAVVPADDRLGGQVLKAVVVSTQRRTAADVRKFCQQQLALHKVPRYVTFVDALPRSATGKVLVKYLLDGVED
jgi:acyl-CoA synthetase (AMP-forming)/AMP-acid ligase II